MWKCAVFCLILLASGGFSKPQGTENNGNPADPDIMSVINTVFTTPSTAPRRGGGFAEIVTPEPIIGPTTAPQIFNNDEGRCICVPYYLCDPNTNTVSQTGEFDGFGQIDIRFNPDTCQDVLDICCNENKTLETPVEVPSVTEKPLRPTGCGIRNVGGLDFDLAGNFNNEAGFGEFPWTVALIQVPEEKCICGGSLIHPKVVLTGSHCVKTLQPNQIKVRAGEWDTQTTKERLPYQERIASQVITHPSFNAKSLANDYGLVVLESPFELADHIGVVCLPQANQQAASQDCFASGWGKDVFGKEGKYSVIMKRVPLPIVNNGECEQRLKTTRLGANFVLSDSFICAGGKPGIDTCQGDGGAPLVCPVGPPSENRYAQNGIVAWGIGCKQEIPAVYANVAVARNWIDTQMTSLGLDTSVYSY